MSRFVRTRAVFDGPPLDPSAPRGQHGRMLSYMLRLLSRAGRALALIGLLAPVGAFARKPAKGASKVKRHHISLRNAHTKEAVDNLWVIRADPKNKNKQWVGKRARKRLQHMLRDWRNDKERAVPERLLWYLYLVGQRFDAQIEVVSGYRSRERKGSRHAHGKAVDFRIEGVDPKVLWDYCKRFDRVGLGYYPTSKFIHMDVRDASSYWIDDSGPGEQADYREGVSQKHKKAGKHASASATKRAGKRAGKRATKRAGKRTSSSSSASAAKRTKKSSPRKQAKQAAPAKPTKPPKQAEREDTKRRTAKRGGKVAGAKARLAETDRGAVARGEGSGAAQ